VPVAGQKEKGTNLDCSIQGEGRAGRAAEKIDLQIAINFRDRENKKWRKKERVRTAFKRLEEGPRSYGCVERTQENVMVGGGEHTREAAGKGPGTVLNNMVIAQGKHRKKKKKP